MTWLPFWNMSEFTIVFIVNVLVQTTLVSIGTLFLSRWFKKNPTALHAMLLCSLVLLLLCPLTIRMIPGLRIEYASAWWANAGKDHTHSVRSGDATDRRVATRSADAHVLAHSDATGVDSELASSRNDNSKNAELTAPVNATLSSTVPFVQLADRVAMIVTMLWAAGTLVLLVRFLHGWCKVASVVRHSEPVVNDMVTEAASKALSAVPLAEVPTIRESSRLRSPIAAGIIRPCVILPDGLCEQLSRPQLFAVLIHEFAHVRRRDNFVVLLQNLVTVVYWFHPLVWLLNRRLGCAREDICDNYVLASTDAPCYSRTLLHVTEIVQSNQFLAMTTGLVTTHRNLESRIDGLLSDNRNRITRLTAQQTVLVTLASLMLALLGFAVRLAPADTRVDETRQVANKENRSLQLHFVGRVVNPDQRPVGGARVFFTYAIHEAPLDYAVKSSAITDDEGKFEFRESMSVFSQGEPSDRIWASIVASADGFGLAYGNSYAFETTGKLLEEQSPEILQWLKSPGAYTNRERILRLAKDDVPVTGRVVNVEGQPVTGARIRAWDVISAAEDNLDSWEEAAEQPRADSSSLGAHLGFKSMCPWQLPSIIPDRMTDANGAFTLRGIGRERIVRFAVSGPGIETRLVSARTRTGRRVVVPFQWDMRNAAVKIPDEICFGADFIYVAGPSNPVVGRVLEADTRQPISGVFISARQWPLSDFLRTQSDAEGLYRLTGLPIGGRQYVDVVPPVATAYLPAGRPVRPRLEKQEIRLRFPLRKGVWVHGRAVDGRTGKPAIGKVEFFTFSTNPHIDSFPQFKWSPSRQRSTDQEGHFRIPVMPGPGVIAFRANDYARYRKGVGAETITGPELAPDREMKKYSTVPHILYPDSYHIVQQVDPAQGSESMELTLTLDSGIEVSGDLTDVHGEPVTGGLFYEHVTGSSLHGNWVRLRDQTFHVKGYFVDQPLDLFFFHPKRNLGGHFHLDGDPPKQLAIQLKPMASVRGRILDSSGNPLSDVLLEGVGVHNEQEYTDEDGRFLIHGLVPGRKYTIQGIRDFLLGQAQIEAGAPGQTHDIGAVMLR